MQGLEEVLQADLAHLGMMVAQLRLQVRVDRLARLLHVAQFDRQLRACALHFTAPIAQQCIVGNQGARHVARARFGIDQVARPEKLADGPGQFVAMGERNRYFQRMAADQQGPRFNAERIENPGPERHQAAQARVLDAPESGLAKLGFHQIGDGDARLVCSGTLQPSSRHRPRVVPSHVQPVQQALMDGDDVLMLPESSGIVIAWPHHARTKFHAQQVEHPRHGGRAAAMHPENQHRLGGRHARSAFLLAARFWDDQSGGLGLGLAHGHGHGLAHGHGRAHGPGRD